jgi:hypothetical protein
VIVCQKCGHQNEDGSEFCASCKSFLAWTGTSVEEPDAAGGGQSSDTGEEVEEATRPIHAADGGGPAIEDVAATERATDPRAAELTEGDLPRANGTDASTLPRTEGRTFTAGEGGPGPEKPGNEQDALPPQTRTVLQERARPGDLVCRVCGKVNPPTRTLCSHCGASLAAAEQVVEERVPWWRRLFRRRRVPVAAGGRPMRRGTSKEDTGGHRPSDVRGLLAKVAKVGLAVVLVGVVVGAAGPWRERLICLVKPTLKPINATVATGKSAPGHPPAYAIDSLANTYWAVGGARMGAGQRLVVKLARDAHLGAVGLTLGAQEEDLATDFLTQPRPESVQLTFKDAEGSKVGLRTIAKLTDDEKFQSYKINAKDVRVVEIKILSVVPAQGGGNTVALTGVEFFESC